jgi:hypothetical protein
LRVSEWTPLGVRPDRLVMPSRHEHKTTAQ